MLQNELKRGMEDVKDYAKEIEKERNQEKMKRMALMSEHEMQTQHYEEEV